jgi:hypothetical protein
VEASTIQLGESVDVDVENLPLDEPPTDDGDDGFVHEATNGVVDEQAALEAEVAEQAALDPSELEADEEEEGVGANIAAFRMRAVRAAMLGYKHRDEVHYTQGPRRWDGIAHKCRSHLGRFPIWADCSSYVTWCLWDALGGPAAGPDILNGEMFKGGYTGTLRNHGRKVALADAKPGDLVHYGTGTGKHVTIVVGPNQVVSHGSEKGPYLLKPNYRPDLDHVRRYVG